MLILDIVEFHGKSDIDETAMEWSTARAFQCIGANIRISKMERFVCLENFSFLFGKQMCQRAINNHWNYSLSHKMWPKGKKKLKKRNKRAGEK